MAIKVRRFRDTLDKYGSGSIKELTKSQVESLQRVLDDFRNYVCDNCMSHAIYKGSFVGEDNKVFVNMFGSDFDGNIKELDFILDLEDNNVYCKGIELPNNKLAGEKLYNLIVELDRMIPWDIAMIDVPFRGKFTRGVVMDCTLGGGKLIAIEDSLDMDYCDD